MMLLWEGEIDCSSRDLLLSLFMGSTNYLSMPTRVQIGKSSKPLFPVMPQKFGVHAEKGVSLRAETFNQHHARCPGRIQAAQLAAILESHPNF
jgi:hypothetical protein